VRCRAESCSFKAPLRIFLMHSHGKTLYSNAHVDFARLHAEQSQLAMPPMFALGDDDGPGGRAAGIREQLLQVNSLCIKLAITTLVSLNLNQETC